LHHRTRCAQFAAQRPKLVTEDWQKVLDLQKAGDVVEGTIKALNRSVHCCDNPTTVLWSVMPGLAVFAAAH